jgi:hypothetical protein
MTLTGKTEVLGETSNIATLPTANTRWTGLEMNLELSGIRLSFQQ